jgi:antitoxin CptB
VNASDRRLLWRCRRGMHELDLALERYCGKDIARWSPAERQSFEALLELPDPLLIDWIFGGIEPPSPFRAHIRRMRREPAD